MTTINSEDKEKLAQNNYKLQVGAVISPMLQKIATFFSIIFHPVLLILYIYLMLALINPYFFGKTNFQSVLADKHDLGVFILLGFLLVLLPLFGLLIMRGLNMISSIKLEQRQERIAPYIVIGLAYLVCYMHLNAYTAAPLVVKLYVLGATIGIAMAFFVNLFAKISIHSVGMGGWVAFTLLALLNTNNLGENDVFILPLVIFIAGLVGTARRLLAAHQPQELYLGYFIGFFAQFLAANFV